MKKLSTPTYIAIVVTAIMVITAITLGIMIIQNEGIFDKSVRCQYNGVTYETGNNFPAGDSCNQCICAEGAIQCTQINCKQ